MFLSVADIYKLWEEGKAGDSQANGGGYFTKGIGRKSEAWQSARRF